MRRGAPMLVRACAVVALVAVTAACSDDGGSSAPTTTPAATTSLPAGGECPSTEPDLLVDQVHDAVAAVEAELGGPQQYFEVNATIVEVTVIVADVDGGTATPFRYRDGTLVAGDPVEGSGLTFGADQLTFDPDRVISCVEQQLPTSTIGMFYVVGTRAGGVRRAVLVTSSAGGQLEVEVGDDGSIAGVDPVDDGTGATATTG